MTIYLRRVSLREEAREKHSYPFCVPCIRSMDEIQFETPVTFLVGENGSGKSTLLESLACAIGSITVGTESIKKDPTLAPARELAKYLRLQWTKRTHRGFFLRAEDFFGYTRRLNEMKAEMEQELREVDETYGGRSNFAVQQAKTPYNNALHDMEQRYGEGLDSRSHGESFLAFFQNRFVPGGLYLLDEPEVPLSPLRQLTLLSLLKELVVQHDAQFIVATHSPIIMALPGALIYQLDSDMVQKVRYEDLEHVTLTRDFLNNPGVFLKHL